MEKNKHRKRKHQNSPKRHTHKTAAGLEDAIAVLIDVAAGVEIVLLRLNKALEILREVRAGPHAYNPDKPAGLRIMVKRK